jgi:hypothetical protein
VHPDDAVAAARAPPMPRVGEPIGGRLHAHRHLVPLPDPLGRSCPRARSHSSTASRTASRRATPSTSRGTRTWNRHLRHRRSRGRRGDVVPGRGGGRPDRRRRAPALPGS